MAIYSRHDRSQQPAVYTKLQAKTKVSKYCAYQERSHVEVRNKLADLGFYGDEAEEVIADLITEGFLNEERFARAFARGKFRMKGWGRTKILQGLKQHQVSAYCTRKAMEEIPPEAYWATLQKTAEKRWRQEKTAPLYHKKNKVVRYLLGRGFEADLAWEAVNELAEGH